MRGDPAAWSSSTPSPRVCGGKRRGRSREQSMMSAKGCDVFAHDMVDRQYDVLVIGATGYTGRLVLEYLADRSASSPVQIAIGGRTISKVQELANKYSSVGSIHVDVTNEQSVVDAVAKTKVVINIAGPYWTRGSVVVKACANHSTHYLDLTGEAPFVQRIIQDYDYLAHKNHAVIIPCSGYDSIPSDLAAYLAVQTLEKQISSLGVDTVHITSTAAHIFKGGLSGGTAATLIGAFEEVPRDKRMSGQGWALSPVSGQTEYSPVPSILYKLPCIQPLIYGGYFPMAPINEPIVRRSWGLRERFRRETKAGAFRSMFSYSEFHQTRGPFSGVALSMFVFAAAAALALLPPVRWIAKRLLPKSGEGPAPDKLDKGRFEVINVSEGAGVAVKSTIKGDGDPGYRLTSIMIVECALLLLDPSNLTPLGQQGGILTPSAAFGERLAQALESTGRFKTSVEILESKKTR